MFYQIGNNICGPVFYNYVLWVLKNAQQKKIKILYFLARDGYLLYKIAQIMCKQLKLNIECRYLYCSRYALRMPTYHFINDEELETLIFANSNEITLKNIFLKTDFNLFEMHEVLTDCNLNVELDKKLNYVELKKYKNTIIENRLYRKLVNEKSISAYNDIIRYFKQEKIFYFKHIGIVDSGWTGSMQRSLRQILERNNLNIKITGFYFGLYSLKHDEKDGEYCAWYFSPKTQFWNKVLFSNNVLECMLSAPHEMTIGYQEQKDKWIPKLNCVKNCNKEELYLLINEQICGCLDYINKNINKCIINDFNNKKALNDSFKILYKFTTFPSKKEVDAYSKFLFCDDVSEGYSQSLADKKQIKLLSNYFIFTRIIRKITKKRTKNNFIGLFWPAGTAVYLPMYIRWWYKINIIIGDVLRILLLARK